MAYQDLEITKDQHVAIVEIQRPPNNFFDTQLINDLADCFEGFDQSHEVRAIVLCSCLLYTSPSPRDKRQSRMPSSA